MPNDLTLEQACKKYTAESVADKPLHVNISEIIAKRNIYAPDRLTGCTNKNDHCPKVPSPLSQPAEKDNFFQSLTQAFRSGGN